MRIMKKPRKGRAERCREANESPICSCMLRCGSNAVKNSAGAPDARMNTAKENMVSYQVFRKQQITIA